MAHDSTPSDAHRSLPPRGLGAWARLGVGMGVIGLFMFAIGPWGLRLPGFSTMSAFIRDRDLKATALYYTDIEEVGQATAGLNDSLRFSPRAPYGPQPQFRRADPQPTAPNCP